MALFGNISASNDISQLTGCDGTAAATAGNIEEFIESQISSPVSLTSGASANLTSLSLTAGDWVIWGTVTFQYTSATQSGDAKAGISASSASLPSTQFTGVNNTRQTTTTSAVSITLPTKTVIQSSTASVYAVAQATFSAGTCAVVGVLNARRVR